MNYPKLRKLSLKFFIAFLAVTGLYAVFVVLVGQFEEFEFKVISSTFTIAAANMCSLSCAVAIEKRGYKVAGLMGIGCAVVAGVLVILGIWFESITGKTYWKSTLTAIVSAAGFAYAFLLLLPKLGERQRWLQPLAVALVVLLAILINQAVWMEIENYWYFRVLSAVAIVVVLKTLILPLLARLASRPVEKTSLLLEPLADGLFRDQHGRCYRLVEVPEE